MDEENMALIDPDETAQGVDAKAMDTDAIDGDWNSAPEEKLGAEEQDNEGQQDDDDDADKMTAGRDADQSFTLKHFNEVRSVGRDEVIALAQKGLDYDRNRGKYDEAAERITAIQSSKEAVHLQADDASSEHARTEKRQAEIREFLAEYGTGVDPQAIPPEVWQSVAQGRTLLGAYQAWELKKLRAESMAASKSIENKTRSAGSRLTLGNQRPRDAIADDWYES